MSGFVGGCGWGGGGGGGCGFFNYVGVGWVGGLFVFLVCYHSQKKQSPLRRARQVYLAVSVVELGEHVKKPGLLPPAPTLGKSIRRDTHSWCAHTRAAPARPHSTRTHAGTSAS